MEIMNKYIKISENIKAINNIKDLKKDFKDHKREIKSNVLFTVITFLHLFSLFYCFEYVFNVVQNLNIVNNISNTDFNLFQSILRLFEQDMILNFDLYLSMYLTCFSSFMIFYFLIINPSVMMDENTEQVKIKFKTHVKAITGLILFTSVFLFVLIIFNYLIEPVILLFILLNGFYTLFFGFQILMTGISVFSFALDYKYYDRHNNQNNRSENHIEDNLIKLKKEKDELVNKILNKKEHMREITNLYYDEKVPKEDLFYYETIIEEFKKLNLQNNSEKEEVHQLIDKTFVRTKIYND